MEKATFGAGCFWGVEMAFRRVEGVQATAVGYLGGTFKDPTYKDVCTGRTGHAEVVEVTFDEARVDYQALLDVFWASHDPTTLNRQGPDIGSQYRSAIFFHNQAQKAMAEAAINALDSAKAYHAPIVTEVAIASTFYAAEEYHQQYLEKRGIAQCHSP